MQRIRRVFRGLKTWLIRDVVVMKSRGKRYVYKFDVGVLNSAGEREGYWEVYRNGGNLYYRGKYVDGKKVGYWEYYYPDGSLYRESYYL